MKPFLLVVAFLHVFFMLAELFPWHLSIALKKTKRDLGDADKLSSGQSEAVANILRNAGIYNGIVASGLFYAAHTGNRDFALVLLIGVFVAGIFGTITLRSGLCLFQGILGLAGSCWLLRNSTFLN